MSIISGEPILIILSAIVSFCLTFLIYKENLLKEYALDHKGSPKKIHSGSIKRIGD